MIKKTVLVCIVFFMCTSLSFGETAGLELNVNASDVEGKFEYRLPYYETDILPGAGALYSDDEYLIGNMNISIRDEIFLPALSLGLGFKGTVGTAEPDNSDEDLNVGAIGFLLLGEYDFRKVYTNVPISLIGTFSGAPSPLCFMDTDRYFDFTFTVYGHIIKNASLLAGYRHLNFRFDENAGKIKKTDNAVFLGCKLHF